MVYDVHAAKRPHVASHWTLGNMFLKINLL